MNINCMLLFSLQLLSKTILILRRFRRDIIVYVLGLYVKYPLFLLECNKSPIFLTNV